ncbi:DNA helicase [Desulfolithobacter dissulfuricans]|uniref:DNA 3'-5' helicase n=1 Tax=Desulfolithobacter dissulfuricans TaxID=2795293 RepID=A0A915XKJ4_9BACT|nr:ATP-dependent helicase [Desulfolithobacter dissulfuricans]BCO08351.1 DNA helicase [Desulfolithobacter dissulfuricans]
MQGGTPYGTTVAMQRELFPDPGSPCSPDPASVISREVLNEAQFAAVTHGEGPVLVIAGAGSGKTRTLVYRMAHLIRQGVEPESILLLTFTRRAAEEMMWRAGQLTGQSCQRIMGGTFHATANMLLRRYGHHLGFGSGFTIIDRGDGEGIINLLKSSLGLAGAGKRFPSKRVIMNILSGSINRAIPIEDLIFEQYIHLSEFVEDIHTIRRHYAQFKLDHGLMDYDDLLVNWQRLLAESEEARHEICSRFQHILVDEYQDTNLIQAEIVRLLATEHDNVMVVGDDAQSIYSFRGADFYNIMRFPEQFPGTRIIKLEENYRSTQPILSLTNAIIEKAQQKFTKELFTSREGGTRPVVFGARNESSEARFIVQTIRELTAGGTDISEIAVLFRSGFHSYKLEMELTSSMVEYEKRGGLKLTESSHIKDALSFLRVVVNPWDHLSWNRILLQLDKVGPKTAQKILATIKQADDPIEALTRYRPARGWQAGFERLTRLFSELRRPDLSPGGQFDLVMEYYEPIFEKIYYDDYPKRRKELDQVKVLISGYGDLRSFVDDTTLDPPESASSSAGSEIQDRLVLSTIHSAKGLEWDVVFVMGLAQGRFPHQSAVPGEAWEEERRLLYVAATRARKQLFLTYPRELVTPDRKMTRTGMSPFLREIEPGLYDNRETSPRRHTMESTPIPPARPAGRKAGGPVKFEVGMVVQHPFFGQGRIKDIPGPRRVEVSFDRHGDKILHLDYAKLDPKL